MSINDSLVQFERACARRPRRVSHRNIIAHSRVCIGRGLCQDGYIAELGPVIEYSAPAGRLFDISMGCRGAAADVRPETAAHALLPLIYEGLAE
ncbi:hypothetical protein EVAR_77177_1 [Eumeta japonica]|uniref:Uncharacterized protein n=1 Tax=Eumeta variegata TaxID=151549 RepID=A0A4C1T247_EUMVA|nr:hypothetical protein EVAR_77177_1 [Eumeta japonica]